MRRLVSVLLLGVSVFAYASDRDGCPHRLQARPDRAFRPDPVFELENRKIPGLMFYVGYAGYGEYLNGIYIGGPTHHQPSFIAVQTRRALQSEHIRLPEAALSVNEGSRTLVPHLSSSLSAQHFQIGNGIVVEMAVQITTAVFKAEGKYFRPALFKLASVTGHPVSQTEIVLEGTVTHGADTFAFSAAVPLNRQGGAVTVAVTEE